MSEGSVTNEELKKQVEEEVGRFTLIGQRLSSIADYAEGLHERAWYIPAFLSTLNREAESLAREVSRCVELHTRLDGFTEQLRVREAALQQRIKKVNDQEASLEQRIRKMDSHDSSLTSIDVRVGKLNEQQSYLLDYQEQKFKEMTQQISDQGGVLALQLDTQEAQITGQSQKLDGQRQRIEDQLSLLESIKLEVQKLQELTHSKIEQVSQTVKTETSSVKEALTGIQIEIGRLVRDETMMVETASVKEVLTSIRAEIEKLIKDETVKTELASAGETLTSIQFEIGRLVRDEAFTQAVSVKEALTSIQFEIRKLVRDEVFKTETTSVNEALSSMKADIKELIKKSTAQEVTRSRSQGLEGGLRSLQLEQIETSNDKEYNEINTSEFSVDPSLSDQGYKTGLKRRRASYDLLSDSNPLNEEDEVADQVKEWRDLFKPIMAIINISTPDMNNSDVTLDKMRQTILTYLSFRRKSPERLLDFLQDHTHEGSWVCIGTLCEEGRIFEPKPDYCDDCSKDGGKKCLRIKKKPAQQNDLRMVSWE
ncbi:hypothetical protein RRF57_012632 [Xylaria bambusicola]|uniref:Uncharacterized protein n=1 Tax=Xylaria bambusicola TaxID=326684 RepID=A0AAN7Z4P2_9PEZI